MPNLTPYEDLERFMFIIDHTNHRDEEGNTLWLMMKSHPTIVDDGDARLPIEEAYIETLKQMKALGMVGLSWDDCRGRNQSVSYRFLVPKDFCRSIVRLEMIVHELKGSDRDDS